MGPPPFDLQPRPPPAQVLETTWRAESMGMAARPSVKIADWRGFLLCKIKSDGSRGATRAIIANAVTILANDPAWIGVLAYDEFAEGIVTLKAPPWRPADSPSRVEPGDWSDEDTTRVQCWLSDHYAIDLGADAVLASIKLVAHKTRVHPVREWLESLRWDGKFRAASWLADVFGAEDSPYTRAVGTAWLVSAVARVSVPGCKVDTVLVLEGKPGLFKSSVLRALAGDAWFLAMSVGDLASKDAMQILRRKWIAEFEEIDSVARGEQAHVKAYFSRQVDTYRPSYGKGSRDFPRQTVFAATTNKEQYLTDETGGTGRRMWPVRCSRGDVQLARSLREQLWAEAVSRYQSSEEWHFRDPELRDAERDEQDARFRSHPWEQTIATWLAKPAQDLGPTKAQRGVTTADVLDGAISLPVERREHKHATEVGAILRRLGWVPSKHPESLNGARVRVYRPQDGAGTNGHTLVPIEGQTTVLEPTGSLELDEDSFPPVSQDSVDGL